MRILNIRLRNLNSLRGDCFLDFTEGLLAQSGLFAITGDTGAGKTTLLDAITLALYGKTAREHQSEILSYGESEAMAELEFDGIAGRYRVHWGLAMKGKKKLIPKVERRLDQWQDNAWKTIESGKSALNSNNKRKGAVEQATGLDFPQFCKSVLLPQGDFAAFLKANEAERAAILERLTDAEIYGKLSIAAHERHKTEKHQLDLSLERLKEYNIPDPEAIKGMEQEANQLQITVKEQGEKLDLLRKNKVWLENKALLSTKKENLLAKGNAIIAQKNEAEADFERLLQHEAALAFQTNLQLWDASFLEKTQVETAKKNQAEALKTSSENLELAQKKAEQSKLDVQKIQELKAEKEERWKSMAALDSSLQLVQQQQETTAKNLEKVQEKNANLLKQQNETSVKNQEIEEKLAELLAWKKDHPQAKHMPVDAPMLETHRVNLRQTIIAKIDLEKKQKNLDTKIKTTEQEKNKAQATFSEKSAEVTALEAHLKALVENENLGEDRHKVRAVLEDKISLERSREKALGTLLIAKNAYQEKLEELSIWRQEQEEVQQDEFHLNASILGLLDSLDRQKEELDKRAAIFQQQQLLANYERDRHGLESGKPCPLCGSLEHPYTKHLAKDFVDIAQKDWEKAKSTCEEVQKQLHTAILTLDKIPVTKVEKPADISLRPNLELGENIPYFGSLEGLETESGLEANRHLNDFEKFGGLESFEESTDETAAKILNALKEKEADIARLIPSIQELSKGDVTVQDITSELEKATKLIEKLSGIKKKFDETSQAKEQATESMRQAENNLNSAQKELDFFKKDKELAEKEWTNADLAYQKEVGAVNAILQKYAYTFEEKTFGEILENIKQQQLHFTSSEAKEQQYKQQKERFSGELSNLNQQLAESESLTEKLSSEHQQNLSLWNAKKTERSTQFGENSVEQERQTYTQHLEEKQQIFEEARSQQAQAQALFIQLKSQQEATEKRLLELDEKLDKESEKILKRLNTSIFESVEALRAALLSETEAQLLKDTKARLEEAEQEVRIQLEALKKQLAEASKQDFVFTILPDLLAAEAEQNHAFEQNQNRIGAVRNQLENIAELKGKFKQLNADIEGQKTTEQEWKLMKDIIGSSDGKAFRIFAQSLTLQQLISLANQHLENLNNRYFIKKKDGESLDLEIIDRYQADNIRSMNTLSGGETFITSLALALGLSSMAGKKANIQSLFIDEGFGALDESALDMAISALENLQSSGLTIGIVSHVRGLKERIDTQVVVTKKGNGMSTVEVVGR